VDGIDVFFGSPLDSVSGNVSATRNTETAAQDEIDAILAVVPRSCRANARWAVPLLLDSARSGGITHLRRIAYVLATAQHGAQFGAHLEERANVTGSDGADGYFERYEPGTPQGTALGNTDRGDGQRFRGRGFVHIKGRASYALWSQRLGLPDQLLRGIPVPFFIAHPAALAQPNVAAQTLVRGMRDGLFTGTALGYYVNDKKTDFYSARRVVSGTAHAREVADTAAAFARAIEELHANRHHQRMAQRAESYAAAGARDWMQEVRLAVERLATRGQTMPLPLEFVDWNGEARQGKFVQLDERTVALHTGRGSYVRLDVQRDLNGVVPPEGCNMALKRSGEIRPAARHGEVNSWR
jgi:hypothetical protein